MVKSTNKPGDFRPLSGTDSTCPLPARTRSTEVSPVAEPATGIPSRGSLFRMRQSKNWYLKFYVNGIAVTRSTGTADEDEARGELVKALAAVDGQLIPKPGETYTFEDAVRGIEADYTLKKRKTLWGVQLRIAKHLRPFFGSLRRFQDITEDHVERFQLQQLEAGYSAGEINRECSILRRMFTLAWRKRRVPRRPYIASLDESANVRRGFLEDADYARLVQVLDSMCLPMGHRHTPVPIGRALRPALDVAIVTAWRLASEILTLQWRNIDRQRRIITIDTSKNGEGRVYPYGPHPELVRIIEAQWRLHEQLAQQGTIVPFVFHLEGQPLYGVSATQNNAVHLLPVARRAFYAACTAIGLPKKLPHDFRRTAARAMSDAGVGDKLAMELGGWKTRIVFDRYDIKNLRDLERGVSRVAATQHPMRSKRRRS